METVEIEKNYEIHSQKFIETLPNNQFLALFIIYFLSILFFSLISMLSPPIKGLETKDINDFVVDLAKPLEVSYALTNINSNKKVDFNLLLTLSRNFTQPKDATNYNVYVQKSINTTSPDGTVEQIFDEENQILVFEFANNTFDSAPILFFDVQQKFLNSISYNLKFLFEDLNIDCLSFTVNYSNYGATIFTKIISTFFSFSMLISLMALINNSQNNNFGSSSLLGCTLLAVLGILSTAPLYIFSDRFETQSPHLFSLYKLAFHISVSVEFLKKWASVTNFKAWFFTFGSFCIVSLLDMSSIENVATLKHNSGYFRQSSPVCYMKVSSLISSAFAAFFVALSAIICSKDNNTKTLGILFVFLFTPITISILMEYVFPLFRIFSNSVMTDVAVLSSYMYSGMLFIALNIYQ